MESVRSWFLDIKSYWTLESSLIQVLALHTQAPVVEPETVTPASTSAVGSTVIAVTSESYPSQISGLAPWDVPDFSRTIASKVQRDCSLLEMLARHWTRQSRKSKGNVVIADA